METRPELWMETKPEVKNLQEPVIKYHSHPYTMPTKPPLSKSKDRLLVAKMSELAKVSSSGRRCLEGNDIERIAFSDCSEC